jgi:DNA-binding response OmpR family regulator
MTSERRGRRAYRALVVEHSTYFSKLMKYWMSDLGFDDVRICTDTDDAMILLASMEFDLIVCDLESAPLNGFAFVHVLRRMRGTPNRLKPVVLTSHSATRRRVEVARDVGSSEFIAKPWSRKVFTQRIMAALSRQRNFIKAGEFFGPDRRRQATKYDGIDRRSRLTKKISIADQDQVAVD